ncbi:MAG: phage terminase small subunit P27 family [Rheinheimera sp.]|uniref:phage terminase small subunit P27 family n=1 Tax=Arsukibacterium sp. UBA3155 TaxID=1946058 RepID=UPI000C8BAD23|nr:phage terminase small subunit P27 family [Arsukibacterium sp. UBA3155]MAD75152.1 phage terminase small subunit P27 family [Rheinheimera sp.]|tara:strand:- start:40331 stop:40807 length:477 start_codon:yes stop_codon:yes gene_type:complete
MSGTQIVAGRGRKPKPTARKRAAGNPGKRKLNDQEPDFSIIHSVETPEWLSENARVMFKLVTDELCREQVLTATDLHNVEAFCTSYSNWRLAQSEIDQNGITVEGAMGGLIKNPAVTVANESLRQLVTFGSLLGLDPSSRSRLIGAAKKPAGNQFSEF